MERSREFIAGGEADPESSALRQRLMQAAASRDESELKRLHAEYAERYPDQLEGVTALLELSDFLDTVKKLDERHGSRQNQLHNLEQATQYRLPAGKTEVAV